MIQHKHNYSFDDFLILLVNSCTNISNETMQAKFVVKTEKDVVFENGTTSYPNREDFTRATLYAALPVNE